MLGRRSLQALLNRSEYLNAEQLQRLIARLNRRNSEAIEAEWELITLAALSAVGHVEHEPTLGGSSRLDIRFRSDTVSFVADVVSVSDENDHRLNPVKEIRAALSRCTERLHKCGIRGGFDFRVGAIGPCLQRRVYKTKLILPQAHKIKSLVFDNRFRQFLAAIHQQPSQAHHHIIDKPEVSLSIVFNPGPNSMRCVFHPPYSLPHDTTHNVVRQALERKADQIKQAGLRKSGELAGVIICDGGCQMLRSFGSVDVVTLDQVMKDFLRGSNSIDFVSVVDVFAQPTLLHGGVLGFVARIWSTERPDLIPKLEGVFRAGLSTLSKPIENATNTLNYLNWAGNAKRLWGKYRGSGYMTDNSIELSSRAVMDFLAGRIDRTEFERIVPIDWLAHLRRCLDQGRRIADVSVKPWVGEDDDALVIKFGDIDAAVSPFRVAERPQIP